MTPGGTGPGDSGEAAAVESQVGVREGQVLAGRYEVRRRVGLGGMGIVYAAFDRNRDKEIALKVLLPHLVGRGRFHERFLNEGRIASELSHPGIVNVFDVHEERGVHFITMELLEGRTLRQALTAHKRSKQPFRIEEVRRMGEALCEALAYAHRTTIHRDIKPENIHLANDGSIKLMDFGIAHLVGSARLTQTGRAIGTAHYMAPEQLRGDPIDHRVDQYATAVLLYEMLTGAPPTVRSHNLRKERPDTPRSLARAIDRALSPEPGDRYADMEHFAEAISGRERRARPLVTATAVLGLAAAAAAGWWALGGWPRPDAAPDAVDAVPVARAAPDPEIGTASPEGVGPGPVATDERAGAVEGATRSGPPGGDAGGGPGATPARTGGDDGPPAAEPAEPAPARDPESAAAGERTRPEPVPEPERQPETASEEESPPEPVAPSPPEAPEPAVAADPTPATPVEPEPPVVAVAPFPERPRRVRERDEAIREGIGAAHRGNWREAETRWREAERIDPPSGSLLALAAAAARQDELDRLQQARFERERRDLDAARRLAEASGEERACLERCQTWLETCFDPLTCSSAGEVACRREADCRQAVFEDVHAGTARGQRCLSALGDCRREAEARCVRSGMRECGQQAELCRRSC